ncbi:MULTISPECIES: heme/hemin ABC transporter substrate-binding protein [Corynebacterium]|uniref:heme/hemin ABC transporter substrate-binding protein n=1 Tax=Corynebacterium TaxID=1716 RepID=UPI0008A4DE2F|nr:MULTISPECIES: ABC transporter substrate-binding protein [Corynebacterium]OFS21381.1 ABC transporter substrate-binding protein [Corynebacterium sp. HMSC04H06]WJY88846.1 Hemin-binding periplasmic protein HmuT precursor [Corynebacterium confusum]
MFYTLHRSARVCILAFVALLCAVSLAACGVQGAYESSGDAALRDELKSSGDPQDPRTFEGVSEVKDFQDVEPVNDNPSPALPVELTDADGYDVTVDNVDRILGLDLYGTYTKTLTGLGLADNIVGRTVSSTEDILADRPVVTQGGHNINVEAVLSLEPTLVIVDHSIGPQDAIDQIRAAGVTTVVMEPTRTIDSVAEDISTLGAVVGLSEDAEELAQRSVEEIELDKEAIADMAPEDPMRVAFLYARGNGGVFFIMGDGTGAKDLIEGVGAVDLATENNLSYIEPANAEALARLNPDAFIMMTGGLESTGGIDGLLERPGVAQTTAGQKRRVITIPDGQSLAFGPMTGQTLLRTAQALYDPQD